MRKPRGLAGADGARWLTRAAYEDLCAGAATSCDARDARLVALFTVVSVTLGYSGLFHGVVLDRAGPRVAAMLGLAVVALGALMLQAEWWLAGFGAVAFGGTATQSAAMHSAALFGGSGATVVALYGRLRSSEGVRGHG